MQIICLKFNVINNITSTNKQTSFNIHELSTKHYNYNNHFNLLLNLRYYINQLPMYRMSRTVY